MPAWCSNDTLIRELRKLFQPITGQLSMGIKLPVYLLTLMSYLIPIVAWAQADPPSFRNFSTLDSTQRTPLSLEQAFPYYVSEVSPGKMRVTWNLAEGHYLYRHAFNFSLKQSDDSDSITVEAVIPDGLKKIDQFFGEIEAYYGRVSIDLSLTTVPGPDAYLVIEYQGCADWGFCYPPQQTPFKLLP